MADRLSSIAFSNPLVEQSRSTASQQQLQQQQLQQQPRQLQPSHFGVAPLVHTTTHTHTLSQGHNQSQGHSHSPTSQAPPHGHQPQTHSLSHPQQHSNPQFNPQQISLDIRTPEELAVVNSFLVALGRDVAVGREGSGGRDGNRGEVGRDGRDGGGHEGSGGGGGGIYFDPASLAQLGLAEMPGIGWHGGASGGGGRGSAASYDHHPSGGFESEHWTTGPGAHGLSRSAPLPKPENGTDGVYPPFPPNVNITIPDIPTARYPSSHSIQQHLVPPHAQPFFVGPPSTPSSSSAGGLGDRDSPSHDGRGGSVGTSGSRYSPDIRHGNFAPYMQLQQGGEQQVPPLRVTHGHHDSYAAGGAGGRDYDFGEFDLGGRRGQPLPPPGLGPLDHVLPRYQNVVPLKSVPTCSFERGGGEKERKEDERLYPSLPSFETFVTATSSNDSPVSLDGGRDKDTLSTLCTSGDPIFKLPAIRKLDGGVGMHTNPLLRPHYRSLSPSLSPPQSFSPPLMAPTPTPSSSRLSSSNSIAARLTTHSSSPPSRYPALPPILPSIKAVAGAGSGMNMPRKMELETGVSRIILGRDKEERGEIRRGGDREREEDDSMDVEEYEDGDGDTDGVDGPPSRNDTPTTAVAGPPVVSSEERKRHAALVRDLLVFVNAQYRTRWGTPPPPPSLSSQLSPFTSASVSSVSVSPSPPSPVLPRDRMRGRDVEMVGA